MCLGKNMIPPRSFDRSNHSISRSSTWTSEWGVSNVSARLPDDVGTSSVREVPNSLLMRSFTGLSLRCRNTATRLPSSSTPRVWSDDVKRIANAGALSVPFSMKLGQQSVPKVLWRKIAAYILSHRIKNEAQTLFHPENASVVIRRKFSPFTGWLNNFVSREVFKMSWVFIIFQWLPLFTAACC